MTKFNTLCHDWRILCRLNSNKYRKFGTRKNVFFYRGLMVRMIFFESPTGCIFWGSYDVWINRDLRITSAEIFGKPSEKKLVKSAKDSASGYLHYLRTTKKYPKGWLYITWKKSL